MVAASNSLTIRESEGAHRIPALTVTERNAHRPPHERELIEWFHGHYWDEDLSLSEAGRRIGYDGSTVSRLFRSDYNGTIEKQTGEVLEAIDKLLAEAGTSKSKVLFCQVILNNIADFAAMNTVYDAWIDPANPPARACIEARLAHPSLKVEIIAIAAKD